MTSHKRLRVARGAACSVAAAVIGLLAFTGDHNADPLRPAQPSEDAEPEATPRLAGTVELSPPGTEPPDPGSNVRMRLEGQRVARNFLRAFLRYQAGSVDAATRRALRGTCTRRLARSLLRSPPRLLGVRPRVARLGGPNVIGPFAGELKAVVRLSYRGLGKSSLELAIAEHGGRLLVTRLYP
jgi:hypothetical protein